MKGNWSTQTEDPLQILLIEDNRADALILWDILEENETCTWHMDHVENLEQVPEALERNPPSVVLLDLCLPATRGFETFEKFKKIAPTLPVIVLTGLDDEEIGAKCIREGAQDYVHKDEISHSMLFFRTIRHAIERKQSEMSLDEAYQKLQSKHDEIQNFYHTLSHELKTPLTSAREFVAILLDGLAGPINETQKEYLEIARESCDQLRVCLDDLLDSTRIETGKFQLQFKQVLPAPFVQRVVTSMQPMAKAKGIDLTCQVDTSLSELTMDEHRMTQVLTNLMTNSLKFTPEGGAIKVTLAPVKFRPSEIQISIADTGKGIPPENLERIFDRLFQVKSCDASTGQGVGLGLYLCKELIDMHGGSIYAESNFGQGSTFTIHLPVTGPESECHVLVVDDDQGMCDMLRELLEMDSYRVTTTQNGQDALEYLKEHNASLVVLDLVMPDMDGATILEKMRKQGSNMPVIIHTGYPTDALIKRAMDTSPFTLLAKPCSPQQFLDTVRRVQRQGDTVIWQNPKKRAKSAA